ncbi:hypothetical protein ACFY1L_09800 [Streptomyces sp. NPDC001663]
MRAAKGKPIEWNFSNEKVAKATEQAFEDAGLEDVIVKYTPVEK